MEVINQEQAIEIALRYKAEVEKHFKIKAYYLYGSYSKGTYKADSDIDIAVIVDRLSDDYFKDTALLWKLRKGINDFIEPILITENMKNPLYVDIIKTGMLL